MSGSPTPVVVLVRLLDEGTDVWRPVQATATGEAFLLMGPMAEGERWEFPPGSVVRCREQRFAGADAPELVAYELVDPS